MIEWIDFTLIDPDYGVPVLVCYYPSGEDHYRHICMDTLRYGEGKNKDPNLVYWDSSDYDRVSHWARINYPGQKKIPSGEI